MIVIHVKTLSSLVIDFFNCDIKCQRWALYKFHLYLSIFFFLICLSIRLQTEQEKEREMNFHHHQFSQLHIQLSRMNADLFIVVGTSSKIHVSSV